MVAVVEGLSTVHEVEGVVFAEAATTTEVVVEPEAKTTEVGQKHPAMVVKHSIIELGRKLL